MNPERPLEGIRVLEYAQYVAGPLAGMLLADLGAEVVKIEPPGGEAYRHLDPFAPGESRYFYALNRGKRSVILDLRTEDGRRASQALIRQADLILHNFSTERARAFGLNWETIRALNPQAVLCTVTAFGSQGPMARKPAYDLIVQAFSGLLLTGAHPWDRLPVRAGGIPIVDLTAGLLMAMGALAGLFYRQATGTGLHVEVSLLAAALAVQLQDVVWVEAVQGPPPIESSGQPIRPADLDRRAEEVALRLSLNPYYRCYQAQDGFLAVACLNQRQREAMLQMFGLQDPAVGDPDKIPEDPAERAQRQALVREIEAHIAAWPVAFWLDQFEAHGIPCAPVRSLRSLYRDPQVWANHLLTILQQPGVGPVWALGSLWHLNGRPNSIGDRIPNCGEHTRAVLTAEEGTHGTANSSRNSDGGTNLLTSAGGLEAP